MITKMIIYLSGPMSGIPEYNFPAFKQATKRLRDMGHRVYSPHEFPNNWTDKHDVRKAFASYCSFICLEAEAIVLLPFWENSAGCAIELGLAKKCGLKIFRLGTSGLMEGLE